MTNTTTTFLSPNKQIGNTTIPITANLGMTTEVMGMVICQFVGFCDIYPRYERDEEEEDPDGGYLPKEHDHDDEEAPSEARANCRTAAGYLVRTGEGALRFRFPYWGMRRCTRARFFDHATFPVPKAVPLRPALASALGFGQPVVIAAGRYYIRRVSRGVEIVVTQSQ